MGEVRIERWFQGPWRHGVPFFEFVPTVFEDGPGVAHCLGSIIGWTEDAALEHVDRIIRRLFPGRVCECFPAAVRIVHFNNNPETTREDVDKVLLVYTEEVETDE